MVLKKFLQGKGPSKEILPGEGGAPAKEGKKALHGHCMKQNIISVTVGSNDVITLKKETIEQFFYQYVLFPKRV